MRAVRAIIAVLALSSLAHCDHPEPPRPSAAMPPPPREQTRDDAPWIEPGVPAERVAAVRANYAKTWAILSQRTGSRPVAPRLRIYRTQEAFLADLRNAGFSDDTVDYFRRTGGAPRPMNGALWVAVDMKLSGVCHELTHSFIEAVGGDGYKRAKWLDEGFATWFEQTECQGPRFPVPDPVKLADMQSEASFTALRTANPSRVYGSAALAVDRLVARFGEAKVLALFAQLRNADLEPAMREVLGIDLAAAQAIVDRESP
jgi:hypothetical protein